jgi:Ala-tRNA(Pro) deacylase
MWSFRCSSTALETLAHPLSSKSKLWTILPFAGASREEVVVSIATSVREYLDHKGVTYQTVVHAPTHDATHTAQAAHVPGDRLAKSVVLEDENGYLMAVLPATHRLDLPAVSRELKRDRLAFASERELRRIFTDCERGAIPPVGPAYHLDTVLDQSLADAPEVYFEAGDHFSLVHVSGPDFRRLLGDAPQRPISHHL